NVEVRPVDINYSFWDNHLEEVSGKYYAVRLGFRQITGARAEDLHNLILARETLHKKGGRVKCITTLSEAGWREAVLEKLADADAFRSIGLDRRQALWEVSALSDRPLALFEGQPSESLKEGQISLPLMTDGEHVIQDYASTTLSLKAHPVSFLREKLELLRVAPTGALATMQDGMFVKVCGLVTVRQRPGTAKGVLFVTIEDETGFANLVVWGMMFEKYRREILQSRLLLVTGKLQIEGGVIHVIVQHCTNLDRWLRGLSAPDDGDATRGAFHKGRNFQ